MADLLAVLQNLFILKDAQCVYCGRDVPQPGQVCAACRPKAERLENHNGFYGGLLYVFTYEGVVRSLIHRFKYDDMPCLGAFMAEGMKNCLQENRVEADVVTHVPIHPRRMAWRGFDQSEILAKELSCRTDIPFRALLSRIKDTRPQFDLERKQRETNVKGAFAPLQKEDLSGKKVLLVDDVCTTGATFRACEKVLSKMGATVILLAYAREN
jgi:ComF family protein